jgi:hypothetical protein
MDMDAVLSLQMLPAASDIVCSVSNVSCLSVPSCLSQMSCASNQSNPC